MTQLTIFDPLDEPGHDTNRPSCPGVEYPACVETYSPKNRKVKYYRLSINMNGNKKRFHIRGGSTITKLATYRATVIRGMIARGAPTKELIAQVTDWR